MNFACILLQLSLVLAVPADWWTRPCQRVIAKNPATAHAANWTLPGLEKRHMGMDDDDGKGLVNECENPAYILTLWGCIHSGAELMPGLGRNPKQGLDDSFAYNRWNCKYEKSKFIYTRKELDELYAKYPITQTYDEAAESLTGPFQVSPALLEPYAIPEVHYHDARFFSDVFGEILVYFISGVLILQMMFNFCVWVLPGALAKFANSKPARIFRKYVTLRPLLGKTLSKKLDLYSTPFPYICLVILFVLNYMFMGIKLNPSNPEPLYPTSSMATGTYLGYRAGFLCMYKLPFIFLFGTRNNIFIWATGWDLAVFNHWHAWLARMVVIDGFIHTGAYVVHFGHAEAMAAWSDAYWTCGFIALLCWTLMAFHGTSFLKKLSFDFFKICHIFLGIASVATLWFHLDYTNKLREIWYALLAVWLFDWILRCFRLNASGACEAYVEQGTENFITIYVKDNSPLRPYAGAHYYVYFWSWPLFWRSHPFTVTEWSDGYMKFVCKIHNGITKELSKRAQAHGGVWNFTAGLEGPMGVKFNFKSFDSLAFFAGGVGITAVYSHLKPWLSAGDKKKITLYWAIRDNQPLEWFGDELEAVQAAGIKVQLFITGGDNTPGSLALSLKSKSSDSAVDLTVDDNEKHQHLQETVLDRFHFKAHRPDLQALTAAEITESTGSLAIFACGAPEFNWSIRKAVANSLNETPNYVQFYEEAFS